MAAEKINDVFLISWKTRNTRSGPSEINIEMPNFSLSCQLTHKVDPSRNKSSVLQGTMEIVPSSHIAVKTNYDNCKLSAIKNGVKHSMEWKNPKCTTTFSEASACGQLSGT